MKGRWLALRDFREPHVRVIPLPSISHHIRIKVGFLPRKPTLMRRGYEERESFGGLWRPWVALPSRWGQGGGAWVHSVVSKRHFG